VAGSRTVDGDDRTPLFTSELKVKLAGFTLKYPSVNPPVGTIFRTSDAIARPCAPAGPITFAGACKLPSTYAPSDNTTLPCAIPALAFAEALTLIVRLLQLSTRSPYGAIVVASPCVVPPRGFRLHLSETPVRATVPNMAAAFAG
jgi:hypothetical protein